MPHERVLIHVNRLFFGPFRTLALSGGSWQSKVLKNRDYLPWLFLLGLGVFASTILAQSPGTFTANGNMTTARVGHTATVLLDGKVLIAGGSGQNPPNSPVPYFYQASAELYDPSTGFSTPTGDMITARSGHSATLLPNGRVLITGGNVASAELYDPFTGTFTAAGGTTTVSGIATLLKNGKVLITGDTAQLYDPAADSFAPTGSYVGPFYYGPSFYPETATLLQDGRVLIVGSACGDCWLEHEELYDPVAGTFKVAGKLRTIDSGSDLGAGPTATLLPNGKVLLAGGAGYFYYLSTAELYDPSTDTFTATANMTIARAWHTATLLPDATVLVAGGQFSSPFYPSLNEAELYNPATGTFSSTGNMTIAREGHSATRLPDGRVLMSGGVTGGNGDNYRLGSVELYTPPVLIPAPMLLSLSGDGQGQGAIQHANTVRIASAGDPAVAEEYLSIYLTGLADGSVIPPEVSIGGKLAEITFFGSVSGYPGLNVINVRMPSGVAPGPAVPVRLTYLSRTSNQVTIGAQ